MPLLSFFLLFFSLCYGRHHHTDSMPFLTGKGYPGPVFTMKKLCENVFEQVCTRSFLLAPIEIGCFCCCIVCICCWFRCNLPLCHTTFPSPSPFPLLTFQMVDTSQINVWPNILFHSIYAVDSMGADASTLFALNLCQKFRRSSAQMNYIFSSIYWLRHPKYTFIIHHTCRYNVVYNVYSNTTNRETKCARVRCAGGIEISTVVTILGELA